MKRLKLVKQIKYALFSDLEMDAVQVQIPPPSFPRWEIEADMPAICFFFFKTTFISYIGNQGINYDEALILLKEHSLPPGPLRNLILMSETFHHALVTLDNHFGSPMDELATLKSKIIERDILPLQYTYDSILRNLREISKYLMIYNHVFSPYEDLTLDEIAQSQSSWVPRDRTFLIQGNREALVRARTERGIPYSVGYQKGVMRAISNYSNLLLAERLRSSLSPSLTPPLA